MNLNNKKFLIAGSQGQLGKAFAAELKKLCYSFSAPVEKEFDLTNEKSVYQIIDDYSPDYIINCAAYNLVDQAEEDSSKAYQINADASKILAEICREKNIFLVSFSSDYVFDGQKKELYTEEDSVNPLNEYGKSKLQGEQYIQNVLNDHLIFRLSWLIGQGQQNFLYKLVQWAKQNPVLKISDDEISVPTFTNTVVNVVMKSLEKNLTGLYHLTNSGYASRFELADYFVSQAKLNVKVERASMKDFPMAAKRPFFSAMSNRKIQNDLDIQIPYWEQGVDEFIQSGSLKFE
jgi:dTDP-4-dehydrorhamnose reductase